MTVSGARILVTGGSGFIGLHLAHRLVSSNHVTVFDRSITRKGWMEPFEARGSLRLIQADVLDTRQLRAASSEHDVVVHAAAVAGVSAVQRSPLATLDGSILGTRNVLEAATESGAVRRVVVLSSSEVTGPVSLGVDEGDGVVIGPAHEPRWAYAMGKAVGEHYANAYHVEKRLPTVVLRPFNIYGPGQIGEGAVRNFVAAALSGNDLVIHGDGTEIRSWTYVADMVEAIEASIVRDAAVGHVFNVGHAGTAITTTDLAHRIIELSRSAARVRYEPAVGPRVKLRIPNVEKSRELLGFEAKTGLSEGLRRTIDSYA